MRPRQEYDRDDFDHVELRRFPDGSAYVAILAEICAECEQHVRYWNDGATGNASCGCTVEGPEACGPIPMGAVAELLRDALAELKRQGVEPPIVRQKADSGP